MTSHYYFTSQPIQLLVDVILRLIKRLGIDIVNDEARRGWPPAATARPTGAAHDRAEDIDLYGDRARIARSPSIVRSIKVVAIGFCHRGCSLSVPKLVLMMWARSAARFML